MLNSIWPFLIIIGCIFGFINGRTLQINNAILESASNTIEIIIMMFGSIGMWNGIMLIASNTSIVYYFMKLLKPIMRYLFPDINENTEEYRAITLNIISNIMGLGNAATPMGIKAIKLLNNKNLNNVKMSNSMIMFIVINTVSLQIIPTTIITLRNSLGSNNSAQIIVPIWIATFFSAITAVITTKILLKKEIL